MLPAPSRVRVRGDPDVPDPRVSERGEMLDGKVAAALVVDDDRAVDPGGPAVDQHERRAPLGELGDMAVVERREGDDQAVDAAVADESAVEYASSTDASSASEERLGLDDHDELAGRGGRRLDAVRDLGEAQVVQARDDQPDRVRAARAQPARERVGPVAELPRRGDDPLARLGPDLLARVAAQDAARPSKGRPPRSRATSLSVRHLSLRPR